MVGWSSGKHPAELEPVSTEGCVYIQQATEGITGSGVQDVGVFGRCSSANPLVYLQSRKIGICDVCVSWAYVPGCWVSGLPSDLACGHHCRRAEDGRKRRQRGDIPSVAGPGGGCTLLTAQLLPDG